jgi:adenylate cyclase
LENPEKSSAYDVQTGATPEMIGGDAKNWLLQTAAQRLSAAELFDALCRHLADDGVPLFRASCGLIATHPQLFARNLQWSAGDGVREVTRPHGIEASEAYLNSPVARIHKGAAEVRCRLEGAGALPPFPVVQELKRDGATDYIALPMRFSDDRINYISWSTDRPGGFHDADIAYLHELMPLAAMRFELESSYFTLRSLLQVYLGKGAGERVLAGTVHRAQGEAINAAIWYADLRDFTAMTDTLPPDQVIATLDDYFDCMVSAVHSHSGEVLKFIGDGVLAIFPLDGGNVEGACHCAMCAAMEALDNLETLNKRRAGEGLQSLKAGIAMHTGEVIYGNIGTDDRLDFTAIGPAVNLVSRIEPLCAELDYPVLASAEFRRCSCAGNLVSIGTHQLRGVKKPQELFTLADEGKN